VTRIAFIGAGSVVFTKNLLGDILALPALRDAEIALHDIDAERLAAAEAMASWVARERDAAPHVTAHDDRRAAIEGSDFVLNMVQIGGHEATLHDFEIPARHGLRQTIADTLGIGGIFRTLRTADHMLALGHEIADLCPRNAWLLNYTNPMAALCWLVYAGTPTQTVVGLCHSVQGTVTDLCRIVGVAEEEVTFLSAGVNHQAFLLRFERDGESLYPLLDRAIEENPDVLRRVRVQMYLRLGYFPTESSEHSAEYLPWLMRDDDAIERLRIYVADYVDRSAQNLVEYEETRRLLEAGEPLPLERSKEYAATIVNSIVTGEPSVIYGNVRNDGLIPSLPDGACVEVPCLVDRTGIRPTPVVDYPPELAALNRTYLNPVELAVRAVLEERPELVRHAAYLDPNAAASLTLDQIDAICDELTRAHGELLPRALRPATLGVS
jgi:alpha-galactosidase